MVLLSGVYVGFVRLSLRFCECKEAQYVGLTCRSVVYSWVVVCVCRRSR